MSDSRETQVARLHELIGRITTARLGRLLELAEYLEGSEAEAELARRSPVAPAQPAAGANFQLCGGGMVAPSLTPVTVEVVGTRWDSALGKRVADREKITVPVTLVPGPLAPALDPYAETKKLWLTRETPK